MPLESCMILLDHSAYMRNGDYVPTRLEAQHDAANLVVGAKTQSHPESTVGVAAGTRLLVSPTTDIGPLLQALHLLHNGSNSSALNNTSSALDTLSEQPIDLPSAMQVASLALKHRRNKVGAQRIVVFVGSPVQAEVKALQKAGRQLKKNNVAIDVVALGELETNEEKLQQLVDAANGRSEDGDDRTCHLVTIPPGVLPSDVLASSPILGGGGGGYAGMGHGGGGGGGDNDANLFADYGGVDPNMDPELAMALRVSMEEERARQERAAAAAAQQVQQQQSSSQNNDNDAAMDEEEALLQQALAMSMNENEPVASDNNNNNANDATGNDAVDPNVSSSAGTQTDNTNMEIEMDEDAAMQMALQMSMQEEQQDESNDNNANAASTFQDPAFVQELLGNMTGVDPNDPEIQRALLQAAENKNKEEKDKKEKDNEKDGN